MENLRIIREKRNKTQVNVAVNVGISQEMISKYESDTNYPTIPILIKLAKYLQTSTDYLLGLTNYDLSTRFYTNNLEEKEQEILKKISYLNQESKNKIIGYIDSLINNSN